VYGCSLHAQRGNAVCENDLLIRRDELEQRLLRGLQEKVLREEVIEYAVSRLRDELDKAHEELHAGLQGLREEKHRIEAELKCLVETIAVGNGSPTVMAAIGEREARIRSITDSLIEPGPGSLQEKLAELRTLAVSRLTDLKSFLAEPTTVHEARALLAEKLGKITLERATEAGKPIYRAAGSIDFFGDEAFTRVGGAGGQNRTGYARLFRAALYH
jgi:hypothetical protein